MEEDREFVYLALERCRSTLNDWVGSAEGKVRGAAPCGCVLRTDRLGLRKPQPDALTPPTHGLQAALRSGPGGVGSSPVTMTLLADVAAGLAALHARAIVHRDLKPHNVLITDSCRAKLSDMGLSKQLVAEQSSFESHGAGAMLVRCCVVAARHSQGCRSPSMTCAHTLPRLPPVPPQAAHRAGRRQSS